MSPKAYNKLSPAMKEVVEPIMRFAPHRYIAPISIDGIQRYDSSKALADDITNEELRTGFDPQTASIDECMAFIKSVGLK